MTETDYYAPNQQVVRADGSGPAEEGDGGSAEPESRKTKSKAKTDKTSEQDPEDE